MNQRHGKFVLLFTFATGLAVMTCEHVLGADDAVEVRSYPDPGYRQMADVPLP